MNFSDFKNSKNLLTNEQMKNVVGGEGLLGFTCRCGFNEPTVSVKVYAENVKDALGAMVPLCDGRGVTCE